MKKFDIRFILTTLLVILGPVMLFVLSWSSLPDYVAIHFNASGDVNREVSRIRALFEILTIFVFTHIITAVSFRFKSEVPKKVVYAFDLMSPVFAICLTLFIIFVNVGSINSNVASMLGFVMMGVILIIIGNYAPKTKPNLVFGFRTKLTLSSEEIWSKLHKDMRPFLLFCGLFLIIVGFLPVEGNIFPVIIVSVLVAVVVVPYVYSLIIAKNLSRPK